MGLCSQNPLDGLFELFVSDSLDDEVALFAEVPALNANPVPERRAYISLRPKDICELLAADSRKQEQDCTAAVNVLMEQHTSQAFRRKGASGGSR